MELESMPTLVPNLDDIICEVLNEEFGVKGCKKGHYWVTDWDDHCRKVFNLYPLKGSHYPLYWGYNFDFIPWEKCFLGVNPKPWNKTGMLVYHRTDRAVKIDFGGNPYPYIGYDFYCPSKHSHEEHRAFRTKYFVEAFGDGSPENIEQIKTVVRRNIPFMLDWFERMNTPEIIIEELTRMISETEKYHGFPFGKYWVRVFLKARLHDVDGALQDLSHVYERFDPPAQIPENVINQINKIDKGLSD